MQRDESGYSMVEVLVAILILVIAIVPMFAMFDLGLRTATTNSNYDKARALAEKQIELAQSLPYKAESGEDIVSKYPVCSGSSVPTPSERSGCLDGDPAYNGLKFTIKKVYLKLPDPLPPAGESIRLESCVPTPSELCAGIQLTIRVYQVSDSRLLFTTTGMVTE